MALTLSALILLLALCPYFNNPDILLDEKYRVELLLVSTLAAPIIDLLPIERTKPFLAAAAVLTFAVNSLAIFLVILICRLTIRGANLALAKLKPYLC